MGKNVNLLIITFVVVLFSVSGLYAAEPTETKGHQSVTSSAKPAKSSSKPAKKQTDAPKRDRSSVPINIKSNEMFADNNAKTATFIGKVVAKQDDVTIYCDKMIVYYGDSAEDIDKIEAIGSVRILQTNRVGTGGHGLYESKIGKITLTINPRVTQDRDTVTGVKIVYFLDDQRSHVSSGDSTRVEAVLYPKKKEQKPDARKP